MATNFPTSLDALTNPASSDQLSSPSHSAQHANANDAIEALQTKVGINNSGGTTSLDYRVKQLEITPTYTNEEAVDAVASALAAGTHSNITITYNDAGNSISISAAAGYTNEEAVDAVAAALTQSSGISIAYNDSANTITISVDSSVVLKTGATMTGALTLSGAPTTGLHAATKAYVDTATATVTSNSTTTYIPLSSIGVADGVASLNSSGVIPDAQIPAAIARDSEVTSAISTAVNNLINSAPGTLDTLNELAIALGNDANFATTVTNSIATKAPIASPTFTGTVTIPAGSAITDVPYLATANTFTGGVQQITTASAATKGLIVQGVASQTANLQEWQDSSGTVLSSISSAGSLNFGAGKLISFSNGTVQKINLGYGGNYSIGVDDYTTVLTVENSAFNGKVGIRPDNATYGTGYVSPVELYANGQIKQRLLYATSVGLTIKGAASQTANLQEWQNSAGTVLAKVDNLGVISSSFGLTIGSASFSGISWNGISNPSGVTSLPSLVVKSVASQTADLQQWQNSAGTVLVKVDNAGRLTAGNTFLTSTSSSTVGLTVTAATGQTSTNIFEVQRAGGGDPSFTVSHNYIDLNRNTTAAASMTVYGANAGAIPLYVKGRASQTADLQQWQNSSGSVLARVDCFGELQTNIILANSGAGASISMGSNGDTGAVTLTTAGAAYKGLVTKGAASQTANLQEWQNSAETVLSKIDASGAMFTITPAANTNTTQVATTAYVQTELADLVNSAPATLDTLKELSDALGADANFATTVTNNLALKAPLASPALTGTPTAPTATAGTNTTQLATTAFVKTEITSSVQPGAVYQTSAPASPAVGQIWIDSDEDVTTFDSNIFNRQSFIATASQTVFISSVAFIEGYEQVYFNGLMLSRSADYTTSGSNTVTLASGAAVNDIIEIVTITALNAYVASQPVSISANTNLAASKRYFVTSASALTLTLPANPSLNDQIDVVDASGNALTYNITIARNGKLINGLAVNLIIDTSGSFISLLYTGPTHGWRAQ